MKKRITITIDQEDFDWFKKETSIMFQEGAVSVYIKSPMGDNNLRANTKKELEALKAKINKLFALIEDELPEQEIHNQSGLKAETQNTETEGSSISG